ncbi:prothoracicostatic peptide-like [Homarus americanus]|uniref:prothoracicostatic peptide-like n=1 Tax=Homarus americanus TaxID=6706 RepID=UPI001C43E293|nr:prothoracicostatic peptide-like [Homarus americanus]
MDGEWDELDGEGRVDGEVDDGWRVWGRAEWGGGDELSESVGRAGWRGGDGEWGRAGGRMGTSWRRGCGDEAGWRVWGRAGWRVWGRAGWRVGWMARWMERWGRAEWRVWGTSSVESVDELDGECGDEMDGEWTIWMEWGRADGECGDELDGVCGRADGECGDELSGEVGDELDGSVGTS